MHFCLTRGICAEGEPLLGELAQLALGAKADLAIADQADMFGFLSEESATHEK